MKEEIIKCDYCKAVLDEDCYFKVSPTNYCGSVELNQMGGKSLDLSFGDFCDVDCFSAWIKREFGYSMPY